MVKEIIKTNMTDALKHIILCHMSEDNADPEDMQMEIQELVGYAATVDIAEKGKVIDLQKEGGRLLAGGDALSSPGKSTIT